MASASLGYWRPGPLAHISASAACAQLEQAWLAELLGGPLVDPLPPREDHGLVEQPTEAMFVAEVGLGIPCERTAVGHYAAE
jgi:hypothetical protein